MNKNSNIEHSANQPSLCEDMIASYLANSLTPEELIRFETWMNSDRKNREEVKQMAVIYYANRIHEGMERCSSLEAYHKVEERINRSGRTRRIKPLLTAVAVAAVIVLTILFDLSERVIYPNRAEVTMKANPGVRTKLMLPDQSHVELNSGSQLSYPGEFSSSIRRVKLNGEAYFNVQCDKEHPFIVESTDGRVSVTATGTAFNVQSFNKENEFVSTLVEGVVEVTLLKTDGSTETRGLQPNQRLIYNKKTDSLLIETVEPDLETAWTMGRIVFKRTKMHDVIKRLAYNYNVTFDVVNPSILEYAFTGTFDNKQLPQVLEYLKISSQFEYTIVYPNADDSREIRRAKVILTKDNNQRKE